MAMHGINPHEAFRETQSLLKEWAKMKFKFGLSNDKAEMDEVDEKSDEEHQSAGPDKTSADEDQDRGEFQDNTGEHRDFYLSGRTYYGLLGRDTYGLPNPMIIALGKR